MRHVALLVMTLISLQEKNEAEELFKKMEEKILQAKTIQVKVKCTRTDEDGKSEVTADVLLGEVDRARVDIETNGQGSTHSFRGVSDGKSIQFMAKGLRDDPQPTPEKFGVLIRKNLAIFGGLYTFEAFDNRGRGKWDPAIFYKVSDFVLGPKSKVGEVEAQMVHYKAARRFEKEIAVGVWIDPKTNLPLKRSIVTATKSSEETYSDLKLDEKIDPATFELPKEAK